MIWAIPNERIHARDCAECDEKDDVTVDLIRRRIVVTGELDEEQGARLLKIAERCPVHRTLEGGPTIVSELNITPGRET